MPEMQSDNPRKSIQLSKQDITDGLVEIDQWARSQGILIDIAVYGGAALSLVFDLREITRDVDVAVHGDTAALRQAALAVANHRGWPEDWLNDGVKGFLSIREELEPLQDFQGDGGSGLRVYTPSPAYLFSMKCMAMRLDGSDDVADIKALARILGIRDKEQAMDMVESFYPKNQIPPKVGFGIEEIMESLMDEKNHNPDGGSGCTKPHVGRRR